MPSPAVDLKQKTANLPNAPVSTVRHLPEQLHFFVLRLSSLVYPSYSACDSWKAATYFCPSPRLACC